MTSLTNHVIVGNGPAGIRAAEIIRKYDSQSRISVISDEKQLYYYRKLLSRFIAGKCKPENLRVYPPSFYEEKAVVQTLGKTVTKVLPKEKLILLDDNREISYDKLLLAVGGKPLMPRWLGSNLKGIMTTRTLEDARTMVEFVARTKRAVVVGGGLLGLNLAQSLRERGLDVNLLVRGERLWPAMLDQIASDIIAKKLEQEGIEVDFNTEVERFVGQSDAVSGVVTTSGTEITCQLVGVSIGITPNVDFLKDSGIRIDKGIVVNDRMQTNIEEIYAAGDVAQAYNIVYKDYRLNTSWNNAVEQGTIAGSNMSGTQETSCGGVCSNSEKIYDFALTSIGTTSPPSADYEVLSCDVNEKNAYRKFVLKGGKMVGALLLGYTRDADRIEKLIRMETDVSDIREKLLSGLA